MTIDWDAELSKLLDEEEHKGGESDTNGSDSDDSAESGSNNDTRRPSNRVSSVRSISGRSATPVCPFTLIAFTGTRI